MTTIGKADDDPGNVSIHTPTKGVTFVDFLNDETNKGVSIHTPTKGVTEIDGCVKANSKVSIHTPTKGVTPLISDRRHNNASFNPHTHEGCDA